MNTTGSSFFKGVFFMTVGTAIILHTLFPSQAFSTMIIVLGGTGMIMYGALLLNLHHVIAHWAEKLQEQGKS